MSPEKAVEAIIREAMERGEFANLPGKGKPLDLSTYFETPEEVRMAFSMLKNAGMLPEEINLLQEMAALRERLKTEKTAAERDLLLRALSDKQLQYNLIMERRKKQP
ncbi:MAG TPA: DUF1992 domain-containing protein [Anaerolineales bacterium]